MATNWATDYNEALLATVEKETTEHWIGVNPVLKLLKANGCFRFGQTGKSAKDRYEDSVDEGNFGSFGAGEMLEIEPTSDPMNLEWNWNNLRDADAVFGNHKEENQGELGSMSSGSKFRLRDRCVDRLKTRFMQLADRELVIGTEASVGGGGEVGLNGLLNALPATDTSGSLGGASRTTYSNIRHKVVDMAAGPSTNALTDAWWLFVEARNRAMIDPSAMGFNGNSTPNLFIGNRQTKTAIENKWLNQNTSPSPTVGGLKSIDGTVIHVSDFLAAAASTTALFLNTSTIKIDVIQYEAGSAKAMAAREKGSRLFFMHAQDTIPGRVNPGDEYFVIRLRWRIRYIMNKGNVRVTNTPTAV